MLPRSSTVIATCPIAAATACGSQAGGASHGTGTAAETEAANTVQSSAWETTVDSDDHELVDVTSSQDVPQYVRRSVHGCPRCPSLRASLDTDSLTVARRIRALKL